MRLLAVGSCTRAGTTSCSPFKYHSLGAAVATITKVFMCAVKKIQRKYTTSQ